MVSSAGPKGMSARRVRRAGIRGWARRGGGALVRHSRRKVQRICRRARRGGGALLDDCLSDDKQRKFTVSSSGPWQGRAGRVGHAGICGRALAGHRATVHRSRRAARRIRRRARRCGGALVRHSEAAQQ